MADQVLGKMAEIGVHFSRLAEVGKTSIEDDLLIHVQELICILSDLGSIVGDQYNRDPFVLVQFFYKFEEIFPGLSVQGGSGLIQD